MVIFLHTLVIVADSSFTHRVDMVRIIEAIMCKVMAHRWSQDRQHIKLIQFGDIN